MYIVVLLVAFVAAFLSSQAPPGTVSTAPPAAKVGAVVQMPPEAYRARQLAPRLPNLAAPIVIERDVALSRSYLGYADHDPDGDGWAVVGDTGLQKLGGLAGFEVANGVPRASVNHPDGCKVITPVRLDVVKANQPRPVKVVEQLVGACPTTEGPFELGSIPPVTVIPASARTEKLNTGGGHVVTGDRSGKLVVPPTALPGETEITVALIEPPAFPSWAKSFHAGFSLEPSGLAFLVPAVLEIRPVGGLPALNEAVVVGWRGQGGPLELLPWSLTADGAGVVVPVHHFSGVGLVASANASLQRLRDAANASGGADLGDFGAQIDQAILSFKNNRDQGSFDLAIALLAAAYDDVVKPELPTAGGSIEQFIPANLVFQGWRGKVKELEVLNEHVTPPDLAARVTEGSVSINASASSVMDRYLKPRCNAAVSNIGDFIAVPVYLAAHSAVVGADVLLSRLEAAEYPFCIRATITELSFPATFEADERELTLRLHVRMQRAVADSPRWIDLPSSTFVAQILVEGATVAGRGGAALLETGADGRLTVVIDRGEEPESAPPLVQVYITLQEQGGFLAGQADSQLALTRAVSTDAERTAKGPAQLKVELKPTLSTPPKLGEPWPFCAVVSNELGARVSESNVTLAILDGGIGTLADPVAGQTGGLGTFCSSYIAPEEVEATTRVTLHALATKDDLTATATLEVLVEAPAPRILPPELPEAELDKPYNQALSVDKPGTWTFAVVEGDLPPGISLGSDGVLTGTPTEMGEYFFIVVAESPEHEQPAEWPYDLIVGGNWIVPEELPRAPYSFEFAQQLSLDPGTFVAVSWQIAAGDLPPGLELDPATGLLAGTATERGEFTFTVGATLESGAEVEREYTLVVEGKIYEGTIAFKGKPLNKPPGVIEYELDYNIAITLLVKGDGSALVRANGPYWEYRKLSDQCVANSGTHTIVVSLAIGSGAPFVTPFDGWVRVFGTGIRRLYHVDIESTDGTCHLLENAIPVTEPRNFAFSPILEGGEVVAYDHPTGRLTLIP